MRTVNPTDESGFGDAQPITNEHDTGNGNWKEPFDSLEI